MVKTASAGGCPLAWGGGMPVNPLTLMGEGMLVTVGALMPGGVLPPAITKTLTNIVLFFFSAHDKRWKGFVLTSHRVTLVNVRGAGPVDR